MNVLVFKTNINTSVRVHRAACRLCLLQNRFTSAVCRWSIDLEDVDCVLRIETDTLTESDVCRTLQRAGLTCEALSD